MSTVHLYNDIHLVFEPGTLILGSLNPDDFDAREEIKYPLQDSRTVPLSLVHSINKLYHPQRSM